MRLKKSKPKCVDCGKETKGRYAKRCKSCHYKYFRGKNNPLWKGRNKCLDCGKEIKLDTKRCLSCYHKFEHGINNPYWRGGHEGKCIDCGKKIGSKNYKRCRDCHVKYNRGENHPLWKEKSKCVDCGKKLKNRHAKRCPSCNYKYLIGRSKKRSKSCYSRGKNSLHWKGGPKRNRCIDCGKKIGRRSTRCDSCSRKNLSGKNSPHFKNGIPNCIRCGKKLSSYSTKTKLCRSCYWESVVGKNSPLWKGKKFKCIDCGREIHSNALRCKPCSYENFCGSNHPGWIGGKPKCKICGKEIHYNAEKCFPCYLKFSREKNKSEIFLEKMLKKILPKEYKYVGQGDFFIKRYNPDFINVNGQKKIIELFGDRWHKEPERIKRDKKKLKIYKEFGYDCLVIWGHELNDSDLKNRILVFNTLIN